MTTYAEFLASKTQQCDGAGFEPNWLPEWLFLFQRHLVDWSVRMGRCAIFADCGTGKSPMSLCWAENVRQRTGKPILLATPLGVTFQMRDEAEKFGIDAAISRDGCARSGIVITNYEQVEKFDPNQFGGMVCDESSILKSFDGHRRAIVTEFMRTLPYRLLCTATAAPNDYIELGTSSEALGYLGHMDMLGRFFTNKDRTSKSISGRWRRRGSDQWRFKGHAEDPFWRWVSSWARAIRKPSDLGFSDNGFILPPLEVKRHIVQAKKSREGTLFDVPANGLTEEREAARRTIAERCEKTAELLRGVDRAVAWCQLNDEGTLLTRLIDGAVEISGSDSVAAKEEKLAAFSAGQIRVLVTKPKIGAWGLNWQHCHRTTYFPSHSYEQYYQALCRFRRFGQIYPVQVDIVTTEDGINTLASLERKASQVDQMFTSLVEHMSEGGSLQRGFTYNQPVEVPAWLAS